MHLSSGTRWILRLGTALTLAFLYVPLLVIGLYAFNERRVQTWPIPGFTLEWFDKAFHNPGVREALWTSLKAGLGATAIAVLLGTLASFAVAPRPAFTDVHSASRTPGLWNAFSNHSVVSPGIGHFNVRRELNAYSAITSSGE